MWEVLDKDRIQRPAARGRRIEWCCSLRTRMRFRSLLFELVDLEQEPWSLEVANRQAALQDEIRSLPNFPTHYDPERDLIVPLTTSEMA